MRVLWLAAFVLALSNVLGALGHAVDREDEFPFPEIPEAQLWDVHGINASNEHCDECSTTLGKILDTLDNNATMSEIQKALNMLCILLPVDTGACRDVVSAVVYNIEKLDKKLLEDYSARQLCTILSFCTVECCGTPYWPQEIHIALSDDPTEMVIMWTTLSETSNPTILLGTSSGALSTSVEATSHTYTQGGWIGTLYTGVVTDLSPSTRYYYQVGDPEWEFSRNIYSFMSSPNSISNSKQRSTPTSATFAIYGDMGATDVSDNNILRLIVAAQKGEIDAVLHIGDISYADGYQPLWDQFLIKVEPLAARVPYMTAAGNHEDFFDFTAYRNRFQMPVQNLEDVSRANMSLYWSVNYGPVHVIAFSCEGFWGRAPDLKPGGAQHEWLVQDLIQANENRAEQPWIIMYAHRPLYCTYNSKRCEKQAEYYRDMIEDVVMQYNVDLVIGAHLHNYERTYPVYQNALVQSNYTDPAAPVYAVVGTGGNKEGTQSGFSSTPPDWSVADSRLAEWGYVSLEADSNCSLMWSFIGADSGKVLDQFEIKRTTCN